MKFIVSHKLEIAIFFGIVILYFLLRLPNLTLQPIFADEAIYIRWAQVMRAEPTLRFLPLSDGKTPLFMWALMPLFKIFEDPLYAGRFLSVLSGFGTLVGIFALGWKVFNKRVALWSSLIYVVVPYTLFFDRMALVDSMLASFTIWIIFITIWLVKSPRLDLSFILGGLLGGALLTKTPAMVNFLVLPFSLLGFNFKSKNKYALLKLLIFWVIAMGIALMIYNILRLGPGFHLLSSRNQDYVFAPRELVGRPLDPFLPHFGDMKDWYPKLLTWPILVLGLFGVFRVVWEKHRLGLVILLWMLIPLLIQMTFLRTFTTRYLLYTIPPFLVLSGYGLDRLLGKFKQKNVVKILVALLLILPLPLYFDYQLLFSPEKANLPRNERKGYFEDWTAGYGLKEIASFLKDEVKKGMVVVGTEGTFGTLPDGLQIYLEDYTHTAPEDKKIIVIGSTATISAQILDAALDYPTYFVANNSRIAEDIEHGILIKKYPKASFPGKKQDAILLFRVSPR